MTWRSLQLSARWWRTRFIIILLSYLLWPLFMVSYFVTVHAGQATRTKIYTTSVDWFKNNCDNGVCATPVLATCRNSPPFLGFFHYTVVINLLSKQITVIGTHFKIVHKLAISRWICIGTFPIVSQHCRYRSQPSSDDIVTLRSLTGIITYQ